MPFGNFLNAYGFDPQDDGYQGAGGLPGLLRQATQQQALQATGNLGPGPNLAFRQLSNRYGNPQGMFGRLLAAQANQSLPLDRYTQPVSYAPANSSSTLPSPADSRLDPSPGPVAQAPAETAPSSNASAGPGDSSTDPSQPSQVAMMDRRFEGGIGRLPIFTDPYGAPAPSTAIPASPPAFSAPRTPEWWDIAKRILQLFPMAASGAGGGGGGRFDTFRKCMRAAGRDEQGWEDFCDDLDPDARQLRAICYSNAFKPQEEKKNFCRAHFGIDSTE